MYIILQVRIICLEWGLTQDTQREGKGLYPMSEEALLFPPEGGQGAALKLLWSEVPLTCTLKYYNW